MLQICLASCILSRQLLILITKKKLEDVIKIEQVKFHGCIPAAFT